MAHLQPGSAEGFRWPRDHFPGLHSSNDTGLGRMAWRFRWL